MAKEERIEELEEYEKRFMGNKNWDDIPEEEEDET